MTTNRLSLRIRTAGFTLVEMMIALFLGFIATIGMYKTFVTFSTAADIQDQTLELQQNLRVTMNRMVSEIRMAGYNHENVAGVGITCAKDDELSFTLDITGGQSDGTDNDNDGITDESHDNKKGDINGILEDSYSDGLLKDHGENITYSIYLYDGERCLFRKDTPPPPHPDTNREYYQKNLDKKSGDQPLNFVYLDKDRNLLTTPVTGVNLPKIKYIQITLVFRSTNQDTSYTDSFTYKNLQGTPLISARNDHRRRQCLTAEVNIRNL